MLHRSLPELTSEATHNLLTTSQKKERKDLYLLEKKQTVNFMHKHNNAVKSVVVL